MGTNKNKTKKLMKLLIATAAMMVAAQAKFVFKGWKPHGKLSECQGDCDSNRECGAGLYCQHDHRGYVRGHNCGSRGRKYADYCVRRANSSHYTFFGWHTRGRLGRCQGDCDSNKDCRRGLRCAQTNGYARGNGCRGRSHKKAADYCVRARPLTLATTPSTDGSQEADSEHARETATATKNAEEALDALTPTATPAEWAAEADPTRRWLTTASAAFTFSELKPTRPWLDTSEDSARPTVPKPNTTSSPKCAEPAPTTPTNSAAELHPDGSATGAA